MSVLILTNEEREELIKNIKLCAAYDDETCERLLRCYTILTAPRTEALGLNQTQWYVVQEMTIDPFKSGAFHKAVAAIASSLCDKGEDEKRKG